MTSIFLFIICQVLKMALMVVIMFALCWLPLHLFTIILDFNPHLLNYIKSLKDEQIFVAVFYICHWLAMVNSFTNPIIFAFLHGNFRVWKFQILPKISLILF